MTMADAMVTGGFRDAGYQYIVIDCWPDDQRDAQGRLQGNLKRFPRGMKALAYYVSLLVFRDEYPNRNKEIAFKTKHLFLVKEIHKEVNWETEDDADCKCQVVNKRNSAHRFKILISKPKVYMEKQCKIKRSSWIAFIWIKELVFW